MSEKPPPSAATFDAPGYFDESVAARYDQGIRLSCPSYDALHLSLAPLLHNLPDRSRFLCAGAGTGAEILTLGARFPSWQFLAVDVSADMLAVCQRRAAQAGLAHRLECFHGRMEDYAGTVAPPLLFDGASSVFVSHFIDGRERKLAYLHAIAAALRPGAPFVLADLYGDPASPEFPVLFQAWLRYYVSHGISEEKLRQDLDHILRNISFTPEQELHALLHEAGFTRVLRFHQAFLFGGWIATRA